jgi:mono/diheme cytochrome c family protein
MQTRIKVLAALAVASGLAVAADVQAGKAAYDKACKSCHGVSGTPNPAIAKAMKVDMRDLSSKEVQASTDAELKAIVTGGKGKMKPVRSVASAADDVVAYVRTFSK